MARSKLHSAVAGGVKDSCSLHRWVLLKNFIVNTHPAEPAPSQPDADVHHVNRTDDDAARDAVEEDAFMFPDPHTLAARSPSSGDCEKQWLDSLLEDLGDDDDDADVGVSTSVIPVDDDDEPLSPLCSPMSSSDDLLVAHAGMFYQPPPIAVPYPVPYPPLHPPLMPSWLQFEDPHELDALPYYDANYVDELPVPDAIEDTSDDESDALSTPYSQSMSSLSPVDPASVPLPPERRRLRGDPHVYVGPEDPYFYPFELDPPLPFPDDDGFETAHGFRPPIYQEC
ncbi:uncharacterized protein BXZ73DRAFT_73074 [Epithele typhae]|uniref:uncharacterized protein n=1 Tax=Epithele typhae TaxID=378194 RepID=UPI0020086DB0|nr:uncharacterized protein BXZ73DRAFT_73074 [Epithele typhae]KAH9946283.1 hypothetical protein BXZ73DRAFT_73074 [Epithele typhae]